MRKPLALALILLLIDQITKYLVDTFIVYGSTINIIPIYDFLNITNIHNTGAAFSIFQGRNFAFAFLIIIFLTALAIWLYKNHFKLSKIQKYAFALILSGGLGNLIDRLLRGAVIDFIDIGINNLRWPSFNVADSCITIAASLIIIEMILPFFRKDKV